MPKQDLTAQTLLAFVFGAVFISILLLIAYVSPNPSDFQKWVYRVVMALAAAGVGAIIPGLLVVNVAKEIRAGGALACFALVYLINPPHIASEQIRSTIYLDLMQRGELALIDGNLLFAKEHFGAASLLAPNEKLPRIRLAQAYYDSGEYATALRYFSKAYNDSNPKDLSLLYGIALSQEGLGELDEALKTWDNLERGIPPGTDLRRDAVFSAGQISLKLLQQAPEDKNLFQRSSGAFRSFLESGGRPAHWAHYHLACIYALKATSIEKSPAAAGLSAAEYTRLVNEEIDKLHASFSTYRSKKAEHHKRLLTELMNPDKIKYWPPGNPVVCPALSSLLKHKFAAL